MNLVLKKIFAVLCICIAMEGNMQAQTRKAAQDNAIFFEALKDLLTNKPTEAEQKLQEYLRSNPNEPAAHYYLSGLYAEQRRTNQAKTAIKKAIELKPENKWYLERYANILTYNKEYLEAADIFSTLAQKQVNGEDYYIKAAQLYTLANKSAKAIEAIDAALKKSGYDEELMMRKMEILVRDKNYEAAEKVGRAMIAQDPKEARNYAQMADFYLQQKQNDKAKQVIDEGIKVLPDDMILQLSLAQYYKNTGNEQQFEKIIKSTITNKSLDAGTQVSLLIPYLQQLGADTTKRKEGLSLAAQLATQHQKNAEVQALYGDLLFYEGQNKEAAEQYKKAVLIDGSKFSVWQQLLFCYTDRPSADSLLKYSDEVITLFPNQAMAHYLQGIGKFNKRDNVGAIRSINRAIDLQPEEKADVLSDMYSTLGDVHNAAKNYKESDDSFEKSLKLNPDNASVLNNFAYYLSLRKENLNLAEMMSRRSLELRPDEATFLDTYGWILYQQGKYQKALDYIQKAIEQNPNADGTLYEHLGDIHFKLGKTEIALKYWNEAKQRGVDDEPLLDKKIREKKLYE